MKRIFLLAALCSVYSLSWAQIILKGQILEMGSERPVEAASISVGNQTTISLANGDFQLVIPNSGRTLIEVTSVNFYSFRDSLKTLVRE